MRARSHHYRRGKKFVRGKRRKKRKKKEREIPSSPFGHRHRPSGHTFVPLLTWCPSKTQLPPKRTASPYIFFFRYFLLFQPSQSSPCSSTLCQPSTIACSKAGLSSPRRPSVMPCVSRWIARTRRGKKKKKKGFKDESRCTPFASFSEPRRWILVFDSSRERYKRLLLFWSIFLFHSI